MKNSLKINFVFFALILVQSKALEYPVSNEEEEIEFQRNKKAWTFLQSEKVFTEDSKHNVTSKISNLDKKITFQLYTKETGTKYQILKVNDVDGLNKSNFNSQRPTKFITHGWRTNLARRPMLRNKIRKAFLESEDCNFIIISWIGLSFKPYFVIRKNIIRMGKFVASFINFLEAQGMNLNNTTLIGNSIGGHLVGIAGYYTKTKVNNVIGLDPARHLYNSCGKKCRISTESGNNVEIIHSNDLFVGNPDKLGHMDFYPNGGSKQPGCFLDILGHCSHTRAFAYFLESLTTTKGFYGMKCLSYEHFQSGKCHGPIEIMGGNDYSIKKRGAYYLTTNGRKPYAKGKSKIKLLDKSYRIDF